MLTAALPAFHGLGGSTPQVVEQGEALGRRRGISVRPCLGAHVGDEVFSVPETSPQGDSGRLLDSPAY